MTNKQPVLSLQGCRRVERFIITVDNTVSHRSSSCLLIHSGVLDTIRPHAGLLFGLFFSLSFMVFFVSLIPNDGKTGSDKKFVNGLGGDLLLKVAFAGVGLDSLQKYLAETSRNRLYLGWKRYLLFGREQWIAGHPAIVKAIFGKDHAHWFRLPQTETKEFYYQPTGGNLNIAMLYTGTDKRWRTARQHMAPFFYNTDFTALDPKIDSIVQKHLNEILVKKSGTSELLTFTLRTTIDLVVQLLYGIELLGKDFELLVASLSDYIVPGHHNEDIKYPNGMNEYEYHFKVGVELGNNSKPETLADILKNVPDNEIPKELKEANYAFFLEALTPAFASFWVISHVMLDKHGEKVSLCKEDPVYRQMCIKEALRCYPPVPALWPRRAMKDIEFDNPVFDETAPPKKRTILGSLLGLPPPPENQKKITIKKGTEVLVIPSVLHMDSRFWFEPTQYNPERWENDPFVLENSQGESEGNIHKTTAKVNARATMSYGAIAANGTEKLSDSKARAEVMRDAGIFLDNQSNMKHNIRAHMFGKEHEKQMAQAAFDVMNECTDPSFFEMQKWTFLPFAMGCHTCMGRRLALRLVDAILFNAIQYEAGL